MYIKGKPSILGVRRYIKGKLSTLRVIMWSYYVCFTEQQRKKGSI